MAVALQLNVISFCRFDLHYLRDATPHKWCRRLISTVMAPGVHSLACGLQSTCYSSPSSSSETPLLDPSISLPLTRDSWTQSIRNGRVESSLDRETRSVQTGVGTPTTVDALAFSRQQDRRRWKRVWQSSDLGCVESELPPCIGFRPRDRYRVALLATVSSWPPQAKAMASA